MPDIIDIVISDLSKELSWLITSGENWQIVLHGGKTGDVVLEVKGTRKLLPTQRQQVQIVAK